MNPFSRRLLPLAISLGTVLPAAAQIVRGIPPGAARASGTAAAGAPVAGPRVAASQPFLDLPVPARLSGAGLSATLRAASAPEAAPVAAAVPMPAPIEAAPPAATTADAEGPDEGARPGAGISIEDFARRAEQLFHGGRLAEGRHGAVIYGPARLRTEGIPKEDEMHAEMARSPLTNPEREKVVAELFQQAGAKPEEIVRQDAGKGRHNIMVTKKGKTDRVIVVGAHHDKVSQGAGTIDNWTGTTMMINLYQAIRELDTEATWVFIGFSREEEGLVGSRFYVQSLKDEQRKKIDAMVNLDTLAVDGTYSWKNNSTKALLDLVRAAADKARLALKEMTLWGGDSDSSSFRRAGIAAMTMLGASEDVIWDILHSSKDTMAVFSLPHYKNAYLVTLALLRELDTTVIGRDSRWFDEPSRPRI